MFVSDKINVTINNIFRNNSDNAPSKSLLIAEKELQKALKPNIFQILKKKPHYLRKLVKRFSHKPNFRSFKLPGRDRVVTDRRHEFDQRAGKQADKQPEPQARQQQAQIARQRVRSKVIKEQSRQNMGKENPKQVNRKQVQIMQHARMQGMDKQIAGQRLDKMLSAFEKMIIARFEGGKPIAHYAKNGQPARAAKTEKQWSAFFKSFAHRMSPKRIQMSLVKSFLFRGLVSKGNNGVCIADMNLNSGRVEKFIRFKVLANLMAKLSQLTPGDTISKAALTEKELQYLSLDAAKRMTEHAQKPKQGRFISENAEQRAAETLGLPIDIQLREKAKRYRKGKSLGFNAFFEKDPEDNATPYRFVPWWHWGNLPTQHPKPKLVTLVFYASLFIMAMLGIFVATYRLMVGG